MTDVDSNSGAAGSTGILDELRSMAAALRPPDDVVRLDQIQEVLGLRRGSHHHIRNLVETLGIRMYRIRVARGWANAVTSDDAKRLVEAYYSETGGTR